MTRASQLAGSEHNNGNGHTQKLPTSEDHAFINKYGLQAFADRQDERESRTQFDIVKASDVTPVEIEWQWRNRFPVGKLTLTAGPPGVGKTMFLCGYYASNVSNGATWIDGAPSIPGDVVVISSEDGIDDTLVPRIIAHGGDRERIHFLKSALVPCGSGKGRKRQAMHLDILRDEDAFCAEMQEKYPNLTTIIADPVTEFAGQFKSNDNLDTRRALGPAVRIAERLRVVFIGNTHFSKSVTGGALSRCIGSTAFVAVARVVWCVVPDPKDPERCLLLSVKNNIAKRPSGLAFRIVEPGRIEWEGETDITADEAIGGTAKAPKLEQALAWLVDRLSRGSCKSEQLFEEAIAAGHTKDTVFRAKKASGGKVRAEREKGKINGAWVWWIEAREPEGEF